MKLKLMLVALATLISSSTHAFGPGFEFGAGVTAATVGFRTVDRLDEVPRAIYIYKYDSTQQSLGANLFASYGTCWCAFPLSGQLDVYILSSHAEHSYSWFQNHMSEQSCRTIVDLSVKPGYLITDCVLLEAKGGISFAHLRQEVEGILAPASLFGRFSHATDSRTRVGYVLGVAARLQVGECLSAYAAFDWHAFSGNLATATGKFDPRPDRPLRSQLTRAYARTFTLGLSWAI